MCDGLQDRLQWRDGHSHVEQVSGEEEVVDVAQQGEGQVPKVVQELLWKETRVLWKWQYVFLTTVSSSTYATTKGMNMNRCIFKMYPNHSSDTKLYFNHKHMNEVSKAETKKTFGFIRPRCIFVVIYLICPIHLCLKSTISVPSEITSFKVLLSYLQIQIPTFYNTSDYKNILVECRDSHCQWWWRLPSRSGTSSRPKRGWKECQKVSRMSIILFIDFFIMIHLLIFILTVSKTYLQWSFWCSSYHVNISTLILNILHARQNEHRTLFFLILLRNSSQIILPIV